MSRIGRRTLLKAAASAGLAPALVTPALVTPALAAGWPSQPVRLVCPFAAGGPTDVAARIVAEGLTPALSQRVIVENRTGAGVVVGTEAVAKARDGHTFLYTTIAHAVLRPLFRNLSFDPDADFVPVALIGVIPMLLQVNDDLPARSLPELIALFRTHPGEFNYGSSGAGGAVHLATELFLRQAGGLRVNHIPYRGAAPAMPDLLNGSLAMFLNVASDGIVSVQRGNTRGLAISGTHRIPQLPDVPTFAEGGLPDYEAYTWHMILAPAGTPPEVVQAVSAGVNRTIAGGQAKQRLEEQAMELRPAGTPATAAAWLRAETAKWAEVIRAAGLQPQ
ncbi:tripartite tricarboxylate transporter substrate-binding protein [Roseomonas sp. NAR14]|uniref:Tripartite tricarboxylate transporter substrate-binding protein n=1 Tax=Roseomonas acroporae TaxID=2937791 RepID=A0A9X2BVE9_9PROT|nr:tripartite tricarboxylate transporter substrate-binding protein [Roseomonas acroporae]MCK8786613.1 tripartite tricarboxylate transporter substrate-binding protein [Roseomonas acroporae]